LRVDEQRDKLSVKLLTSLPEDALVPGELELIQAHLAGLIDRVFLPEVGSEPLKEKDQLWP
jgi:hypothetical protein